MKSAESLMRKSEGFDQNKLFQHKMRNFQMEREKGILKNRLNLYVQGNTEEFIPCTQAQVSRLSDVGEFSILLRLNIRNGKGNYTEEELVEYLDSYDKAMTDFVGKASVVDIENTLSRVCQMILQDNNAKKEELCLRPEGLKIQSLAIFSRKFCVNGNVLQLHWALQVAPKI